MNVESDQDQKKPTGPKNWRNLSRDKNGGGGKYIEIKLRKQREPRLKKA